MIATLILSVLTALWFSLRAYDLANGKHIETYVKRKWKEAGYKQKARKIRRARG